MAQHLLSESTRSKIYLIQDPRWSKPVIKKVFNASPEDAEAIEDFRNEGEMLSGENIPVRKCLEITEEDNTSVILLEHFEGFKIGDIVQPSRDSLITTLKYFEKVCDLMHSVHGQGIIHRNLSPDHILVNPQTHEVSIIDFSLATRVESMELNAVPKSFRSNLHYISPEHSGRMNRNIDSRSDIYSAGIILFELITGLLPFQSEDPVELIHSHVALAPPLITKIRSDLPEILDKVIQKALSKSGEDRYQSMKGFGVDIRKIRIALEEGNTTSTFELAEADVPLTFRIPQKLYGRDEELKELKGLFRLTGRNTSRLILVSGYSGVGKTSLVLEVHKSLAKSKGYFLKGKFDLLQNNVPYAGIKSALEEFVEFELTGDTESIEKTGKRILEALGADAYLLNQIVPSMELLIGKQPLGKKIFGIEGQNRVNHLFTRLMMSIASKSSSITIFLDDLQWIDSASLNLIHHLTVNKNIEHLLLIGAYRSNEVDQAHPLTKSLQSIESEGISVKEITIDNLKEEEVASLVSDSLMRTKKDINELANAIYSKTAGNAFYVNQVLKALFSEGHLFFDEKNMCWEWNLEGVRKLGLTDNVIDLLINKLKAYENDTRELLNIAGSLGNKFPLDHLLIISRKEVREIRDLLRLPEEDGLIRIRSKSVEFAHDKIQQAAYELSGEERSLQLHLEIGRFLLSRFEQNSEGVESDIQIFEVINQLNAAEKLVSEPGERKQYAQINLEAGTMAKNSAAYSAALEYFHYSQIFLGAENWDTDYEFLIGLHTNRIESAYLSGHSETLDRDLSSAIEKCSSLLDKIPFYRIRIEKLKSENNLTEALEEGLEVLNLLSLKLPHNPSRFDVLRRFAYLRVLLAGKQIDKLKDLPLMEDPLKKATIQLLVTIGPAVYWSSPNLTALVILEMVILSLRHGNTDESAFAYSTYGLLLCGLTREIELGYKFGKLARHIAYKFGGVSEAKGIFNINCFVNHWKDNAKSTLPDFEHAYNVGMNSGDLEFAALSAYLYGNHAFHSGMALRDLSKIMETNAAQISQIKQNTPLNYLNLHYQTLLNFMGSSSDPTMLSGTVYDENEMLPRHLKARDKTALFKYHLLKMMLHYYFEAHDGMDELIDEGRKYEEAVLGMMVSAVFEFYAGMIYARVYETAGGSKKRNAYRGLKKATRKFRKWAEHSPDNHLHKYLLLKAELDRVNGDTREALLHYENAIQSAEKNGYLHELGLAYELNGNFHVSRGMKKLAGYYFEKAADAYSDWGASAKVAQLRSAHPEIEYSSSRHHDPILRDTDFDLQAILRASEAVSREIKLNKLTKKLLRIVVESVLAENGFLLISKDGKINSHDFWSIEYDMENNPPEDQDIPQIPMSIVNTVEKTREGILITDVSKDERFKSDPVVKGRRIISSIAVPLITRNELVGIIYLENNKIAGAFSEARFSLLNMLSGQMAVSLGNALLFEELEKSVTEQRSLKEAYSKFLPGGFLETLQKDSILDVLLGDQVVDEMTLMFCGIKDYREISDSMTDDENFAFINGYFSRINPIIHKHGGFILRFMGDGFLAIYPGKTQDAFDSGVAILQEIRDYNSTRVWEKNRRALSVGIGLHRGKLIMGVTGDKKRMAPNVVSDVVSIASRIQALTYVYGTNFILSDEVMESLDDISKELVRSLGKVIVKDGGKGIRIFDCIKGASDRDGRLKKKSLSEFESAIKAYFKENFAAAAIGFKAVVEMNPDDAAAGYYLKKSAEYMANGVPENWSRAEEFIK